MNFSGDDLYVSRHTRLGDTIISLSNAIYLSKKLGKKLYFSLSAKINGWPNSGCSNSVEACHQRLEVAKYLLNYEPFIDIVDHRGVGDHIERPKYPLVSLSSNAREFPESNGTCCIHLTGRSWKTHKRDQKEILKRISEEFPRVIDCNSLPLMEAIIETTKCAFFVGVDSGFSHVAHAARKEVNIIRSGCKLDRILKNHHKSECTVYDDASDFVKRWPGRLIVKSALYDL